jgi:hypothetical protein
VRINAPDEAPSSRRKAERKPADLAGWLIRSGQDTHDFSIINLSYSGCRIRTQAPLQAAEAIRLCVRGRGSIEATVRWADERGFGLEFASLEAEPACKRQGERTSICVPVVIRRQGRTKQWMDASDLSAHGCCVEVVDAPRVGDTLWVQLPGVEPIEAEARWVEGARLGLAFKRPIHPAVFDLLVSRLT